MKTPIKMIVMQFASVELALAGIGRLEEYGLFSSIVGVSYRRRSCSIRFEFTDTSSAARILAVFQVALGLSQGQDDRC